MKGDARSAARALARSVWLLVAALGLVSATGCARMTPTRAATAPSETLWVVTERAELLQLSAARPEAALSKLAIQGLALTERLLAVTFRPGDGAMVGVSSLGKVYRIDRATGQTERLNTGSVLRLAGLRYGLHADPVSGVLNLVSDHGQNLRLDPATGRLLDDGAPTAQVVAARMVEGEPVWQGPPAALKLNAKQNAGLTDGLVAGWGMGPMDSADLDWRRGAKEAIAAMRRDGVTRLYAVNLVTGQARVLGRVDSGRSLWAMAVQP